MRTIQGAAFVILLLFFLADFCNSQPITSNQMAAPDTINTKINFLKKYFFEDGSWHSTDPVFVKNVEGLLNFIQGLPIDSVLLNLSKGNTVSNDKIIRFPGEVEDSLNIPGFLSWAEVRKLIPAVEKSVFDDFAGKDIKIPASLLMGIENRVKIIPPGQGMELISDSVYHLPDSLKFSDVVPDSLIRTPDDFNRLLKLDSIRDALVEKFRMHYNDSLVRSYRDSVILSYQREKIRSEVDSRLKQLFDSVKINNYHVIQTYNDSVIAAVNDSARIIINDLIAYARRIDTTRLVIQNLKNESQELILGDSANHFARVWLKNEQNDSVSVLVTNVDKNRMKILIDDNVSINRFLQQETKDFDFNALKTPASLEDVKERYKLETPWSIGGDGNVGFTQTYLSNWSKGGKSAVSMLLVLKGFANYSTFDNKLKWENSAELRNGWLKPGGTNGNGERYEFQKNDDKIELISRIGVSAFKKWYYSAEVDFETQFFNGYKYPTSTYPDPISAFLSPGKFLFKLGLDYKPNQNLSVFLSPFTSKTVFVLDTVRINKNTYNIPDGKRRLWVPGLNADIKYKTDITPDISYETKYKMFINYTKPFEKFDVNWENLLVMKVNDYINMRFMLHLIYDDDVLFAVSDLEGNELYRKPKLQVKELITVGFSYKINKKVYRTRRLGD